MLKNFKRRTSHSCLEFHKALKDERDLVSEGQGEGISPGRRAQDGYGRAQERSREQQV